MNKLLSDSMENYEDELLPEYRFDYAQATRSRFAGRTNAMPPSSNQESVNQELA